MERYQLYIVPREFVILVLIHMLDAATVISDCELAHMYIKINLVTWLNIRSCDQYVCVYNCCKYKETWLTDKKSSDPLAGSVLLIERLIQLTNGI